MIMTSLQEVTQVPATHIGQSHRAKTFNGSHPLTETLGDI